MNIPSRPWKKDNPPRRVLAIRLQALGDLVITLPYLQQLRNSLPANACLDLLTREEVDTIPKHIDLFTKIYSIGGGRSLKKQVFYTCLLLPKMMMHRYDVVIDLQNNIISRIVRHCLMPRSWSEFDRFSPVAAGESTRLTIEAAGIGKSIASPAYKLRNRVEAIELLKENGWNGKSDLIVLNPAGAFASRNWPIDNYVRFARLWMQYSPQTQFLILGTDLIAAKSDYLKTELGDRLINLVNKTSIALAFGIIQHVKLVLSEDSGLMHMSWVSGIPTIAMFGSTWGIRAQPLGAHTISLDSSDLDCGNCRKEYCRYGDTHCLTRYTAEMIFEKAISLV